MQTTPIHREFYRTDKTPIAAALMSLGVDFANTTDPQNGVVHAPISTEHNAEHPNGVTSYFLHTQSETGRATQDLVQAWAEHKADVELDQLLGRAYTALESAGKKELADQIRAAFPLALMVYYWGFSQNRDRLLDLRSKGRVFRRFRRGQTGFVLISDNASDETRRHVGLPARQS